MRAVIASVAGLVAAVILGALFLSRSTPTPALDANWQATVTVLAGSGIAGVRDGAGHSARFADPFGIAAAPDGTVIVADGVSAHRIRRVSADGYVATIAGGQRGWKDGPGAEAQFDTPTGVAIGPDGSMVVADTGNNAVRRIGSDGRVSTLTGLPGIETDGGTAADGLNGPLGLAFTPSGSIVIADTYNDRLVVLEPSGRMRTLAGRRRIAGFSDGPGSEARFDTPSGVAVDAAGTVYVADTGNDAIRLVSPTGTVATVAPLPPGGLFRPTGVAVADNGVLYVVDEGGRVVEILPNVRARVLAGEQPGFSNGVRARFRAPSGVALIDSSTLVVTDRRNALVRVIEALGRGRVRGPGAPSTNPHFDFDAFSLTPLLWPIHPQEGPFEITGTMGEIRGGEEEPRFHAGLDIRAVEGTTVRAVRDGVVSDPVAASDFDTLGESLRVGPLVYVHQRVGRSRRGVFDDPRLAPAYRDDGTLRRVRVKRGARYSVGEPLGTTNAFNHVHLNIGWPREEHNALAARLVQFADHVAPFIPRGGVHLLLPDGTRLEARVRGRLLVSGPVRIIVEAWDQADGNRSDRRLGLYRLGYQVLDTRGVPVPGFEAARETVRFDRLAPDDAAPRTVYAPGSGIPFYGRPQTRFLYEVTNRLISGVSQPDTWDPAALPTGDYIVRVMAGDASGNVAVANRDVAITLTR